jgi:triacylglycerol esterase/lipase EstA (alpha/beta hydrolase family)
MILVMSKAALIAYGMMGLTAAFCVECKSEPNDQTFLVGASRSCLEGTCKPTEGLPFRISRAIGDGINTQVTDAMVMNKVIAGNACIEIEVQGLSAGTSSVSVEIDNQNVLSTSVSGRAKKTFQKEFDVRYLRFARSGGWGRSIPTTNRLEINISQPPGQCNSCSITVSVRSITIEAVAPILLVHGRDSDDGWFKTLNFAKTLEDLGYSVRASGNISRKASDTTLASQPSLLDAPDLITIASKVKAAATQFAYSHDVRSIHLIAHSKGGLWSRKMLGLMFEEQFTSDGVFPTVYSLTTLDTPHHGSALADASVSYQRSDIFDFPASEGLFPTEESVDMWMSGVAASWNDKSLQPSNVQLFNASQIKGKPNQLPEELYLRTGFQSFQKHRIQYSFFNADANANGNISPVRQFSIIEPSEACVAQQNGGSFCMAVLRSNTLPVPGQYMSIFLQRARTGTFDPVPGSLFRRRFNPILNSPPYAGNDLAVTVPSAEFPAQVSHVSPIPYVGWKRNHTTIGSADVAAYIAANIITLDRQKKLLQ